MEILETKERKMNKIKREEREDLHTFSDTTYFNSLFTFFAPKSKQEYIKCYTFVRCFKTH